MNPKLYPFSLRCLVTFVMAVLACGLLWSQSKYTLDPSVRRDKTGYKLRSGDRVRIIVQGETDASVEATLGNYGTVKPAYINELSLSGLSAEQAAAEITKQYQKQLIYRRPFVNVVVTKYTEQVVFLSGSVNKKGPYAFPPEVEAMSIVEVIARAGGFSEVAKKNKVYVTRTFYNSRGESTDTKTYEVDVEALSQGTISSGSAKRFWIYPGDRIEVPERLF